MTSDTLRSRRWLAAQTMRGANQRARIRQLGFGPEDFADKPVIAILNTWSEMNTCHGHFRERAEDVRRGVHQAGGFPVELPAVSLGEIMMKPTTMLYRNMLAMEAEELLRCHPIDGVVLMGGCDKTTPALLMAAASMDIPAIFLPAGPMLRGYWRGETLGSGTDMWKYWAELRAGTISDDDWSEIEAGFGRSHGHCMTMGTASTMTSLAEALGMTLPGAASIPAVDSGHARMAAACGRTIVDMIRDDVRPSKILSERAFRNALRVDMALGGSTNAAVHMVALAGRAGVELPLEAFDEAAAMAPLLANIRPAGQYLMEDFYYAGGLRALLGEMKSLLDLDAPTVNGRTLGENLEGAEVHDTDVIRSLDNPVRREPTLAIQRGNLAPGGAMIKPIAADPDLLSHTGPAVVFENYNDMEARIDRDDLDVTADSVLVLKGAGPLGGPGFPEWGMLPIPKKLLKQGVRDMVRISDGRMSGTSYGTCILHVAPEAYVGGPLALVQDGDMITLDVGARRLSLDIPEDEMTRRREAWTPPPPPRYGRGWGAMFSAHVTQADKGCDFDYLQRDAGPPIGEPEIH
jgi:dihydroxy-acid dehydratase